VAFRLHGIGLLLAGATPADEAALRRHVGPLQPAPDARADVTLRYVDDLPSGQPAELELSDDGASTVLCLRRGLHFPPLVVDMVRMAAIAKGVLPLHAAAFEVGGTGVAVTGWSGSGKTGALLGFLRDGASYLAAEWVLVPDGAGRLQGLTQPLRVRDWHLRQIRELRRSLSLSQRFRLELLGLAAPLGGPLQEQIRARRHADVAADRLPWGAPVHEARFDHLVLLEASRMDGVHVQAVDGLDVAGRLAVLLENDLLALRGAWLRSRYRAPAWGRSLFDDLEERQRHLVRRCLGGRAVLWVRHPARGPLTTLVTRLSHHLWAA
jgi:hypothetical protein